MAIAAAAPKLGLRSLHKGGVADVAIAAAAPKFDAASVDVSGIEDAEKYLGGWQYQCAADREVVIRTAKDPDGLLIEQDACHMEKQSGGGYLYRSFTKDANRQAVPVIEGFDLRNESLVPWDEHQLGMMNCYGNSIDFNSDSVCFLSDQQKGLLASHSKNFPMAGASNSYKHLEVKLSRSVVPRE